MLRGYSGRLLVDVKQLESPQNLDELEKAYFHVADILAEPGNGFDPADIGRVITLRPNLALVRYRPVKVKELKNRGYFAHGEREGNGAIRFKIFCPHLSLKSKFPPKALETAVDHFALELNGSGCTLPQNSIKYLISEG